VTRPSPVPSDARPRGPSAALLRFLARRLCWFLLTLFAVVLAAFLLMRAVRGGPFDGERALDPAIAAAVRARYHLDWPLWRQFAHYVGPFNLDERGLLGDGSSPFGGALAGDLGPSFKYRDFSVNQILAQSLPISLTLGGTALCMALALGFSAGALCAWRRGTALDLGLRILATLGLCAPNFVIAGLLALLFSFELGWLPVAGWGAAQHLWLPALSLAIPLAATLARLLRASLLETLAEDHVRTARAKGLSDWQVLWRHALRPALLPLVSYLGPATAGILTGSLVIEKLFAIPGTGSFFVMSALNRDYPLALGVTIVYTALVYGLNTLVDLAYGLLDPRLEGAL
jgi:oligopeptide transport system permease protein